MGNCCAAAHLAQKASSSATEAWIRMGLEHQPKSQLRNARGAGARHLAEGAGIEGRSYTAELRMVEQVEELGAELKRDSLLQLGLLNKGNVPVVDAGRAHQTPSRVPESAQCRQGESAGGEPLRQRHEAL